MFESGNFRLHSGDQSLWKINCDCLSTDDWATLAALAGDRLRFSAVVGIPQGGLAFAEGCRKYADLSQPLPVLIVDDVLTTGASMEEFKARTKGPVIGCVVFARGPCPDWVTPIFHLALGQPIKGV